MLKFSAKGEYALLLVQYLLRKTGVETLSNVSKELWTSESLIRKAANDLERSGIVKTKPGRSGGIEIARREISVYDVLHAVGEDTALAVCERSDACGFSDDCSLKPLIRNLQRWIDSILKITKIR